MSISTDLSWGGGDSQCGLPVTYEVYFGTSLPPEYQDTVSEKVWSPQSELLGSERYYWRIITTDSNGSTPGPIWEFVTEMPPAPMLDELNFYNIDDDDTPYSDGNDNGIVEVGERIEIRLKVNNNGQLTATNVMGILTLSEVDDDCATVTEEEGFFPDIAAGDSEWQEGNSDYDFRVDCMPPDQDLDFTLTMYYDDTYGTSYISVIDGIVIPVGTEIGNPECQIEPEELHFPDMQVGECAIEAFQVSNVGGADLSGYIEEDCDHFNIKSGAGPFTLSPGESRTVEVEFKPTSSGPKSCQIDLGSDCNDAPCYGTGLQMPNTTVYLGYDKSFWGPWEYSYCDGWWQPFGGAWSCDALPPYGYALATAAGADDLSGSAGAVVEIGAFLHVESACGAPPSDVATIRIHYEYKGLLWGAGILGGASAKLVTAVVDPWDDRIENEAFYESLHGIFDHPLVGSGHEDINIVLQDGGTYTALLSLEITAENITPILPELYGAIFDYHIMFPDTEDNSIRITQIDIIF